MRRTGLATITLLALACAGVASADAPVACAPAAQREALLARWNVPAPRLATIAREAGVSEAAALSVLPPDRAFGVAGGAFHDVWRSLEAWPAAVTVIAKGGHVFEVHGPIPGGEPSKVSQFFNLATDRDGLTGHLRPDLVASIYATSLPGRERVEHGILFFDAAGAMVFGVYVPNEQAAADSATLAAFEATRAALQKLPRACP